MISSGAMVGGVLLPRLYLKGVIMSFELLILCICVLALILLISIALLIHVSIVNKRRRKLADKITQIYGWYGVYYNDKNGGKYE